MRLARVLVRFYKSFNFDYEAKASGRTAHPWEEVEGQFYPFVEVGLDPEVTAIVGANESGKSHLVSAIRVLLGDLPLLERDFCRYSRLFSVERGARRFPDIGGDFVLNAEERQALTEGSVPLYAANTVRILRRGDGSLSAVDGDGALIHLNPDQCGRLTHFMPRPWSPRVNVPLADSVPIARLLPVPGRYLDRQARATIIEEVASAADANALAALVQNLFARSRPKEVPASRSEELAATLLVEVARVAPSVFLELQEAIREGHEGLVNGLVQQINASLGRHLNLARWWSQDSDFSLRVSPREQELVFTIRDRTGTDYSSGERSTGLVHFLGYLVQFQAHESPNPGEILLMDEPDAYLSASGQQDLLRLIDHYAVPDDSDERNQALYVTHSPFLVNRNAGHRIRVLDKGVGDEGTRVVKDVTRNRYEPLRSAIGVYVAETAFIGGLNLFVEGVTEQVLLAGTASELQRRSVPLSARLDLNSVTIVNSGSASSVAYMLYIARGQDEVKPPSIVLLDSDASGRQAQRDIQKGGAFKKPLIKSEYVTLLGEWADSVELRIADYVQVNEIEDLIPEAVMVRAARNYAENLLGSSSQGSAKLRASVVAQAIRDHDGASIKGLQAAFEAVFEANLDKFGFAKEVVRLLEQSRSGGRSSPGIGDLLHNFEALHGHLARLLRRASDDEEGSRRDRRLNQAITDFKRNYVVAASRDAGNAVVRSVENLADESMTGDAVRSAANALRRDFELEVDPLKLIEGFDEFTSRLEGIRYAGRLASQQKSSASPQVSQQ